jgi:hypothetical protein
MLLGVTGGSITLLAKWSGDDLEKGAPDFPPRPGGPA